MAIDAKRLGFRQKSQASQLNHVVPEANCHKGLALPGCGQHTTPTVESQPLECLLYTPEWPSMSRVLASCTWGGEEANERMKIPHQGG